MAQEAAIPIWLAALDEDDLHFLRRFLLQSGSLKAVAEEYEVSYPTVRARLDRLIAKVQAAEQTEEADAFERKVRLMVADGWLPPNTAKELLTLHRQAMKGKKQ